MTVLEALQAAKTSGCKAYKVKKHDTFGYIITSNNNILAVSKSMWGAGVVFTFEYIPSQKTGSGCACMEGGEHDFGITEINAETIAYYEKEGFEFAKKLKATFYSSPAAWMEKLYWKKDIEEI